MSMRDRPWRFGMIQGFQGCQAPCTIRGSQVFRKDRDTRALLPLEGVQKSGKLHMITSESPKAPEEVLSWGSQVLNGLTSVIMTQQLPEGCEANSLVQHLLILVDFHFLMKLLHHKIFSQLYDLQRLPCLPQMAFHWTSVLTCMSKCG